MSRVTPILPLALLLACTVPKGGDTATDGTSAGTGSTGGTDSAGSTSVGPGGTTVDPSSGTSSIDPTTAAATETSASSSAGTDATTAVPPPDLPTDQACDPWAEDCPAGMKCMPVSLDGDSAWESLRCVPIAPEPDGLNEPCELLGTGLDGLDTCDIHTMCWDVDRDTGEGTCLGMCTGSVERPDCEGPQATCLLTGDGVVNLCFPNCDPLESDCPAGQVCVPAPNGDSFLCAHQAGQGQVFEACEFQATCEPGLVCLDSSLAPECDPQQFGCCLPFCDLTEPDTCPGMDLVCLPWWEMAEDVPGLENVGVCGVMP